MRLLEIGPGDEVLVSAMSYIATVNCIVRAGATSCLLRHRSGDAQHRPFGRARTDQRPGARADRGRLLRLRGGLRPLEPLCRARRLGLLVWTVPNPSGRTTGAGRRSASASNRDHELPLRQDHDDRGGRDGPLRRGRLLEPARRIRGQGEVPGRKYIHDTLGFNHRITDVQGAIGRRPDGRAPGRSARARARSAARYLEPWRSSGCRASSRSASCPGATPGMVLACRS